MEQVSQQPDAPVKRGDRVVVTGGAGFIGSAVASALVERGAEVIVVDDLSGGSREAVPPAAELLVLDVADDATVAAIAARRPRIVIHAAAQVSVARSVEAPGEDLRINVIGTHNVLAGAAEAGVERFVFISSGGAVYGEASAARESDLPRPLSYYAVHKWTAEQHVRLCGLSYAVARPANVYGPGQRGGLEGAVVAAFAEGIRDGGPLRVYGDGEQRRDFVFIADVVDALLAMAQSRRVGAWNVGTGRATSINELADAMLAAAGSRVPVVHEAPRPGDVRSSSLDTSLIVSELGWEARWSLEDGLASTLHGLGVA